MPNQVGQVNQITFEPERPSWDETFMDIVEF